jgi:hypothetical protein
MNLAVLKKLVIVAQIAITPLFIKEYDLYIAKMTLMTQLLYLTVVK